MSQTELEARAGLRRRLAEAGWGDEDIERALAREAARPSPAARLLGGVLVAVLVVLAAAAATVLAALLVRLFEVVS